jgi:TP901 family phage tail tape measure protein
MNRTVLEELVVKFIGDASQFNKVVEQVKSTADKAAESITRAFSGARPAPTGRMNTGFSSVPGAGFAWYYGKNIARAQQQAGVRISPLNLGYGTVPGTSFAGYPGMQGGAPHMPGAAGGAFTAMLHQRIGGFGSAVTNAFTNAEKMIKQSKILPHLHRIGYEFRVVGQAIQRYFTAPILAAAAASIYAFARIDDSITTSSALFGGLSEDAKAALQDTIFKVAKTSRISVLELSRTMEALASAGYSAKEAMEALSIANSFAIASGMNDAVESTKLLIGAQSALGLRVDDNTKSMANMKHVGDLLVKANQLAQVSVEDFSRSLVNKSAAALRLSGKDAEEGIAILAAYASQNVKANKAGTDLTIVIRDLQTAVMKNASAWEALVGRNVIYDTEGEMNNLGEIIVGLSESFEGLTTQQKKFVFTELGFVDKSSAALQMLLGMGEKTKEFERQLRNASGTMDKVTNERMGSFLSKMMKLYNILYIVGHEIGEILAPEIEYLGKLLERGVNWWNSLGKETKRYIVYAALVGATIGLIVTALGALAIFGAAVVSSIGIIGAAVTFIGPEVAAIVALVGAVAVGLFGWSVAFVIFYRDISKNTKILLEWFGKEWSNIFVKIFHNVGYNFGVALGGLADAFVELTFFLAQTFTSLFEKDFPEAVVAGLKMAGKLYWEFSKWVGKIMTTAFMGAFAGGAGTFEGLSTSLDAVFKKVQKDEKGESRRGLMERMGGVLTGTFGKFKNLTEGITGPDFGTAVEHNLVTPMEEVNKAIEEATKSGQKFIGLFHSNTVEGAIAGTAEAYDRIQAFIERETHSRQERSRAGATTPDMIPSLSHPGPLLESKAEGILDQILEELKIMNRGEAGGGVSEVKVIPIDLH